MKKNNDNLVFASSKDSSSDFGIEEKELSISDQQKILITVIYADKKRKYSDIFSAKDQVDYESISDEYLIKFSQQTGPDNISYLLANQFKILENIEIQRDINLTFNDFFTKKKEKSELNQELIGIISQPKKRKLEKARKEIQAIKQKMVNKKNEEKVTKPISDKSNNKSDNEVQQTSGLFSKITRRITDFFTPKTTITHKIDERQLTEELKAESTSTKEISIDKENKLNTEEIDANIPNGEIKKEEPCSKCLEFSLRRTGSRCGNCGKILKSVDLNQISSFEKILSYSAAINKIDSEGGIGSCYREYLHDALQDHIKNHLIDIKTRYCGNKEFDSNGLFWELGEIYTIKYELLKKDYLQKNANDSENDFETKMQRNVDVYNKKCHEHMKEKIQLLSSFLENFLCQQNGIVPALKRYPKYLLKTFCSEMALSFFIDQKSSIKEFDINSKKQTRDIIDYNLDISKQVHQAVDEFNPNVEQKKLISDMVEEDLLSLLEKDNGIIVIEELIKFLVEKSRNIIEQNKHENYEQNMEINSIAADSEIEISNKKDKILFFSDLFNKDEIKKLEKFINFISEKINKLINGDFDKKYSLRQQREILLGGGKSKIQIKEKFISEEIKRQIISANTRFAKKNAQKKSKKIDERIEINNLFIKNIDPITEELIEKIYHDQKQWIDKIDYDVLCPYMENVSANNPNLSNSSLKKLYEEAKDHLLISARNNTHLYQKNSVDRSQCENEFLNWLNKRLDQILSLETNRDKFKTFKDYVKSLPYNKRREILEFRRKNVIIKNMSTEEKGEWLENIVEYGKNHFDSKKINITENDLPSQ